MPRAVEIDVLEEAGAWPEELGYLRICIEAALEAGGHSDDTEVSIVLTDDTNIQTLNRDYRGKDKPTNVLSFPQDDAPGMLGDIVLAHETILREAEEQDKDFDSHLKHLVVHGCLHLLGYDHENDEDAEEMEALEVAILQKIGVKNPYNPA
jgi:probable rRNA maturation factor